MNASMIRLLMAAVVLAGLVLFLANPFQDSVRKGNPESVELFTSADPEAVDALVIRAANRDAVELSRNNGEWIVQSREGFPADTSLVGGMLRAMRNAQTTTLASNNPKNRSKFQVDSTGVEVTAKSRGETVAHFYVGKTGRDFTASYVRRSGEDAVYLVRGINRNRWTPPRGFRDASIMTFEYDAVDSLTRVGKDLSWSIARSDSVWMMSFEDEAPFPARDPVVSQLVRQLGRLAADAFLEGPGDGTETGLEAPGLTFSVFLNEGRTLTVHLGNKDEQNRYFAARPDRPVTYLVNEWKINQLNVSREKFKEAGS